MSERDMYYNSYGYGGFMPVGGMGMSANGIPGIQGMPNNMGTQGYDNMNGNTFMNSQFNDINERVSRLERQIKRLDQRIVRLETPYANNAYSTDDNNNMYMM